jgi:hypothetical protein
MRGFFCCVLFSVSVASWSFGVLESTAAWKEDGWNLNCFNQKVYNSLPSSVDATLALRDNGNLEVCLEKARKVVDEYDAGVDFLGFRLVHRHNSLRNEEIMVEEHKEEDEKPLIISSTRFVDESSSAIPVSWILGNGGICTAFEYVIDPIAKAGYEYLVDHMSLFKQISEVTYDCGLGSILAPAVVERGFHVHFRQFKSLLEESRMRIVDGRDVYENVLRGNHSDELELEREGMAPTLWSFRAGGKSVGCMFLRRWCPFRAPFPCFFHVFIPPPPPPKPDPASSSDEGNRKVTSGSATDGRNLEVGE